MGGPKACWVGAHQRSNRHTLTELVNGEGTMNGRRKSKRDFVHTDTAKDIIGIEWYHQKKYRASTSP